MIIHKLANAELVAWHRGSALIEIGRYGALLPPLFASSAPFASPPRGERGGTDFLDWKVSSASATRPISRPQRLGRFGSIRREARTRPWQSSLGAPRPHEGLCHDGQAKWERPPEFPRAAFRSNAWLSPKVRRVGAGGRKFKPAEPPKREGSDGVLSASLQADDAAISPHLRPSWRKGAISPPFVSRQPWFRDHATLWTSFHSRLRIYETALGCPCQSPS